MPRRQTWAEVADVVDGAGTARDGLVLSVHGPAGALDLVVPGGAAASDVAREYAARSGLAAVPLLYDRTGTALLADVTMAAARVGDGAVLAAVTTVHRPDARTDDQGAGAESPPGPLAVLWCCLSVSLAVPAGWLAARYGDQTARTLAGTLLLAGAALGCLPVGRLAPYRALAAPALGAVGVLALAWDPHPGRLPMVVGVTALTSAVVASVVRAFASGSEEGLRVWIVGGVSVFALTSLTTLGGAPAPVPWALLLGAAMLAPRLVPALSVDVPDRMLIDVERLAVTAWSARERPRARRGRVVVPPSVVDEVARRGTRLLTASAVGAAVVATLSAHLLLASASGMLDVVGARCQVLLAGAALLLAARSHRHPGARALLRLAGLACWVLVAQRLVVGSSDVRLAAVAAVAVTSASLLVVVAVAAGRGWRSIWWSRRAEVAEGLAGAAALASMVVSTGAFRAVWELGSRAAP